jgi:caffeoyl-CoA O-methyltransferase
MKHARECEEKEIPADSALERGGWVDSLALMSLKYVPSSDALHEYVRGCRTGAADPLVTALQQETARLGDHARMQISDDQASFMSLVVAATGVRSALEIGTFTGGSALAVARALPPGGRLLCLDQSVEWTNLARKYWALAGVQDRIELRLGSALDLLRRLEPERMFDFVFIDAEKTEYDAYYELILPRVRANGLILFDNMLWGGGVLQRPILDEAGKAIDNLNRKLCADPRIEAVLLPIADGLQFCRKLR